MGNLSLRGRVLWAGLVVLVGCQADPTMAPIDDVPAAALGEFGGLAAGGRHTCVPRINLSTGASTILCWGADLQGQQGNGGAIPGPNNLVPATVSNSGAFERLAAGLNFMCALPRGGGTPSCWGENNHGQLGNGTLINASTPTPVLMPPKTTFTAIAAGDDHVCGLAASKLVYCWGGNAYGQVGNSSNVDQRTPVPVHGARLWATISLGGGFTCGVELSSQWAYCWGRNHRGQYGIGNDDATWWYPHSPVEDPNPTIGPIKWKLVKAGGAHACAITVGYNEPANKIWCWGANDYGQTGAVPCTEPPILSCTAPLFSPRQVFSSVDFSGVDLGGEHTCAASLSGGDLYCWGRGSEGQLGRGSTVPASIPQKIGNVRAINVALGARHTVIRTPNDAAVMAWGNNGNGQVGDGSLVNRSSPVVILP